MPTYDVRKEPVEGHPTLIVKADVLPHELADKLAEILPRVLALIGERGVTPAGPPFTRYNGFGDKLSIEAGMAVSEAAEGKDDIEAGSLPGGDAAVTDHMGPYDELPQAHAALMSWAFANKRKPDGGPYELYKTDPGEEPDPRKWLTRVILPLVPT